MDELQLETRVGHSINHFGLQFLNHVEPTNAVFSPISLCTALYIVHLGMQKNSDSANEISTIFDYKKFNLESQDDSHKGLDAIYKYLLRVQNSTIATEDDDQDDDHVRNSANSTFDFNTANLMLSNGQVFGDLKENFKQTLNKYYEITLAKFNQTSTPTIVAKDVLLAPSKEPILIDVNKKEQIIDSVNEWVGNKTKGKIDSILNKFSLPDDLQELACIIVNAVYLKAQWRRDYFDKEDTREYNFFNEGDTNKKKLVPFMQNSDVRLRYYDSRDDRTLPSIDFKALEIPYKGTDDKAISLVILLPNEMDGLSRLEKELTWSNLKDIYSRMKTTLMRVKLPKFKFEQQYDGREILELMNVRKMFTREANLTEMFTSAKTTRPIEVDKIVHKAMIEVDEKGIEAAAATAVIAVTRYSMVVDDPILFYANHPFLFIVRHVKTDASLFIGRVMNL